MSGCISTPGQKKKNPKAKVKILSTVSDEPIATAEKAQQLSRLAWQGKELHPFTVDREGDWLTLRTQLGSPSLAILFPSGAEAFLADAIRILFFCSHEPSIWAKLTGNPYELDKLIREWSLSNIPKGAQFSAVSIALDIYNLAHEPQQMV